MVVVGRAAYSKCLVLVIFDDRSRVAVSGERWLPSGVVIVGGY